MIRYFIGLEVKDGEEFIDWVIIEERKGFVCPRTDTKVYECKGCNAFPKGERVPGQSYACYIGMVETYCPTKHLESEFVLVGVGRRRSPQIKSVKGVTDLMKKIEKDLYKPKRKIGLYIGVEGIGLSVLVEKLLGELKHIKVITVSTEGTEKLSKDELIGNAIALQDVIKVSGQLKGDPVYLELERQRRSLRVSSFTLACWGVKQARGGKKGRVFTV